MKRREALIGAAMALACLVVPAIRPAKGAVRLEQYERFRMFRDGITSSGAPIFVTGWEEVAFEDIIKCDLIRRTSTLDENLYQVDRPADYRGRLHVSRVARWQEAPNTWCLDPRNHVIPFEGEVT